MPSSEGNKNSQKKSEGLISQKNFASAEHFFFIRKKKTTTLHIFFGTFRA